LKRAATKSNAAYVSSLAAAIRTNTNLSAFNSYNNISDNNSNSSNNNQSSSSIATIINTTNPLFVRTQHALQSYHQQVASNHSFPRRVIEYFRKFNDRHYQGFPCRMLQKLLMNAIKKKNKSLYKQQLLSLASSSSSSPASIQLQAHYHAICADHSSTWLLSAQTSKSNHISNRAFEYSARYRLNVKAKDDQTDICVLCQNQDIVKPPSTAEANRQRLQQHDFFFYLTHYIIINRVFCSHALVMISSIVHVLPA
jgi:hypothetical protein